MAVAFAAVHGRGDGPIGSWGLVQVLPVAYWVLLPVPTLVFAYALRRGRHRWRLAAALGAQAALLHGVAAAAESMSRFPTAWLHAGFTNQIMTTGQTLPAVDARFSWPGFFTAAGIFAEAVGVQPMALLRWAPLFFALVCLLPASLLFRSLTGNWRIRWIGLFVLTTIDWVGQDYFAPQAFGLVLYLTVLAVVCTMFLNPRGRIVLAPLRRWVHRRVGRFGGGPARGIPVHASTAQRVVVLLVLTGVIAALAMSHQLTPLMLVAALAALALTGRLRAWPLAVAAAVVVVSWISYGAVGYWTGHLAEMFGSAGRLGAVLGSGVTSRVTGSAGHRAVVDVRMAFSLLVWLVGAAGAVRASRRGPGGRTAILLAVVPFGLAVTQSYGGEGILRVFLFAAAPVALLAGHALHDAGRAVMQRSTAPRRRVAAAVALTALVVLPTALVARYGNESFERMTPSDVATMRALYRIAPAGSTLASLSPNLPWGFLRVDGYDYRPPGVEFALRDLDELTGMLSNSPKGAYLAVTDSQLSYAEQVYGLPAGWAADIQARMIASGAFRVVFRDGDGVIYQYVRTSTQGAGA